MPNEPKFTSNSELTITETNKDPRLNFATNSALTSAGGTIHMTSNPNLALSLGVYKNGAAVSVAVTNDINANGNVATLNFKEDPDHDSTSTLDYLKNDTRGITAGKIVRAADTVNVVVEIRALNYKANK